ncbi:MAG TPA: ankyrin repeat domain-containing protein [Vicinamibacterales bacterium]|nr:ankyrin repeat domain-containing protein [Vicinamibacterales bacterium]
MRHFAFLFVALACFPAAIFGQEVDPDRARDAAAKALAAIQKAQSPWYTTNKQVCASCHHQYQPALAYRVARDHGVPFDESIARADATKAFDFSDIDRAVQYTYVIEPSVDDAYRMIAANAAGVKPNLGAAVYARLLISRQNAQGDWDGFHQRPPSSYSRMTMAALGLRAVQLYHHASQKAQAEAAVARARGFLENRAPRDTEERTYQLLGLRWAGAPRARLQSLARELKALQRPDGGWNSVNGRESDAYSTAQALVALHDGGGVAIIDTSYQRGIEFLLKTQALDGSWHVTSRLHPPAPVSPPYFEAGYPNGHDQFLSMQGASWAVMALSYALEPARPVEPPSLPGTEPANVEAWVETMIFGTRDDVRKLLDGGLNPNVATKSGGTTALMMAAPDVDKMTLLLDRGADVNARANSRYSTLMVAAQYQEADPAINLLLDRGAQVAPPGAGAPVFNANPFFLASYAGNAKSLKRLLAAGGKLDDAMVAIGTSRTTPMLGAFKFGDIEVARTLLDLGAPVDFADGNGITMLGRAALNNDIEMARLLISRGAAVNVVDKLGMTPLLWAANIDFGDAAMIELLLQSGANAGVRNKDGLTPLELAKKFGHANLIPALLRGKATN